MADPTIVGTPTNVANGGNVTVGAGSNRLLVILAVAKDTAAHTLTNILYNSVTRTPVVTTSDAAGQDRVGVGICVFKESELAGGASAATATWSGSSECQLFCYTVKDADQSTTVRASGSATNALVDPALTATVALSSISVGDLCLGAASLRASVTVTHDNSFTEDFEAAFPINAGVGTAGHKTATSTTETYSITVSSDSSYAMAAVAIMPVTAPASNVGQSWQQHGSQGVMVSM